MRLILALPWRAKGKSAISSSGTPAKKTGGNGPPGFSNRVKSRRLGPPTGPTWGHLFGQIIIGVIEILIPLAFIVGMIYWRAPWLFWAIVHFLRGEPILNF